MNDFIADIITRLEAELPELGNRIQPSAVDPGTATPFAAFTLPTETPIRTIDGIAGYDTTFEVAVVDKRHSQCSKLKSKIIEALDSFALSTSQRCQLKESQAQFYDEQKLHGYIITFNIN